MIIREILPIICKECACNLVIIGDFVMCAECEFDYIMNNISSILNGWI